MDEFVQLVVKDFGPAGGFAILLLGPAGWAIFQLFRRLSQAQDQAIATAAAHAEELAACQLTCEKEKVLFRDQLERRYQEQSALYQARDQQNRQDIQNVFARYDNLMQVVTDAISRQSQAVQDLRFLIRERQG